MKNGWSAPRYEKIGFVSGDKVRYRVAVDGLNERKGRGKASKQVMAASRLIGLHERRAGVDLKRAGNRRR